MEKNTLKQKKDFIFIKILRVIKFLTYAVLVYIELSAPGILYLMYPSGWGWLIVALNPLLYIYLALILKVSLILIIWDIVRFVKEKDKIYLIWIGIELLFYLFFYYSVTYSRLGQ